jgi:hypothetical protein
MIIMTETEVYTDQETPPPVFRLGYDCSTGTQNDVIVCICVSCDGVGAGVVAQERIGQGDLFDALRTLGKASMTFADGLRNVVEDIGQS